MRHYWFLALLRLDDDEDRSTAAIDQQEDRLAAAASNSTFELGNRVHGLAIHLSDHVTLTETGVGRSRARIHLRHDDAFGSGRQLQLGCDLAGQVGHVQSLHGAAGTTAELATTLFVIAVTGLGLLGQPLECYRDLTLAAFTLDRHTKRRARSGAGHAEAETIRIGHRLTVDCSHDVALFQTSLCSRSIRLDASDSRTRGGREIEGASQFRSNILRNHTDVAAA